MTRHQIRRNVVQILYNIHLNNVSLEEASNLIEEGCEEAKGIALNVLNKINEVDSIISSNIENYEIKRLNVVDRSIIEYATYELMFDVTPKEIVISEALKLTEDFSDEGNKNQVKFNNKLLDKIAKTRG